MNPMSERSGMVLRKSKLIKALAKALGRLPDPTFDDSQDPSPPDASLKCREFEVDMY
jgi:hypothetical protein